MRWWRAARAARALRPWRKPGRWLRLALVGVLVFGIAGVGAAPAYALATCGPGSELVVGYGCINPTTGDLTKLVYDGRVPSKMNKLSSELDAVGGPGNTKQQKVGGAVLAGSSKGSRLLGKVGAGLAVYSGFSFGYSLGEASTSFACGSLGWSVFCDPREDVSPDFEANADYVPNDSGWDGAASVSLSNGVTYPVGVNPLLASVPMGQPAPGVAWSSGRSVRLLEAPAPPSGGVQFVAVRSDGTACSFDGNGFRKFSDTNTYDGGVGACQVAGSWVVAAGIYIYPGGLVWSDVSGKVPPSGWLARWFSIGSAFRPPAADPDPLRRWETTVQCKTSGGSTKDYTATSAEFRETDGTWPALPSITCPDGEVQSSAKVRELGGPSPIDVWSVDIPQNIQDAHVEFPQCVAGGCLLTLWSVNDLGVRTDCFADSAACENWLADPQREQHFQCTYGLPGSAVDVALAECYVYGPTFNPLDRAHGDPYGDPADGSVVPLDVVAPGPSVEPDGGPSGLPGMGGSSCFPSGWGVFNPMEWVFQPVKCALTWAFVPRAEVLAASLTTAATAVKASAPVGIAMGAAGAVTDVVSVVYSSGCAGDVLNVAFAYVVWPCDPPIPGWSYVYLVIVVIVIVGGAAGAFGIIRSALDPR